MKINHLKHVDEPRSVISKSNLNKRVKNVWIKLDMAQDSGQWPAPEIMVTIL
jgi:hypothetical protein